jgi:hypothetical protein
MKALTNGIQDGYLSIYLLRMAITFFLRTPKDSARTPLRPKDNISRDNIFHESINKWNSRWLFGKNNSE